MSLSLFDDLFFRPVLRHEIFPSGSRCSPWPYALHRRKSSEAEDEFDRFVRSVDSRFGGMLAQLQQDPQAQEQGAGEQGESSEPERYRMKIAVQNFKPDDIKIKVQGNNLVVEAKREEKRERDGMYAHSYSEFRRSFPLPKGVDKKQLQSSLTSCGGVLEVDAPMLEKTEPPKKPKKHIIDVEHTGED